MPDDILNVAGIELRSVPFRSSRIEFDAVSPYLKMLKQRFGESTDAVVAIDPGNGAAALTAPAALRSAGAGVHAIRSTPRPAADLAADPQNPDTLRELARVTTTLRADLGIAWDGDSDRIGVLDHLGRRYEADWLSALLARPLLARRAGAEILLDLKTSSSAIEDVERHGGRPLLSRTGYSFFAA